MGKALTELRRPLPRTWWMKRKYTLFMVREWTSLFVGGYAVFLIVLVARARDKDDFAGFYQLLLEPLSIVLHAAALAMVLFHTVTWLNLAPKAASVWFGERRLPAVVIAGVHYAAWLIATLVVLWLVVT